MKHLFFTPLIMAVMLLTYCDIDKTSDQNTIAPGEDTIVETRTGSANNSGFIADYSASGKQYVSASTITTNSYNYTIDTAVPRIDSSTFPGDAISYLYNRSCLGYMGPMGPLGPLGELGPIGTSGWLISSWIDEWQDWVEALSIGRWYNDFNTIWGYTEQTALGMDGPLGYTGPVSSSQYYGTAYPGSSLFTNNDFAAHLRAFGLWSVLGPIGPFGALGPLGPLGPIGAHGYYQDSSGNYRDGGSSGPIVRTEWVLYSNLYFPLYRTYELYEKYSYSRSQQLGYSNDTSFMVETSLTVGGVDIYKFTSAHDQVVTILVVPEIMIYGASDDFDLRILNENGEIVASSTTGSYIDWIQIKVPAGTKLQARVNLYASYHVNPIKTYRIFVTGSTQYINKVNVSGAHVKNWLH